MSSLNDYGPISSYSVHGDNKKNFNKSHTNFFSNVAETNDRRMASQVLLDALNSTNNLTGWKSPEEILAPLLRSLDDFFLVVLAIITFGRIYSSTFSVYLPSSVAKVMDGGIRFHGRSTNGLPFC